MRASWILVGFAAATSAGVTATPARADVSSWLALGGGAGVERNRSLARRDSTATFTASVGVGTTPLAPIVVGGLLRSTTFAAFSAGTDLGLALRVCTGGYARGDWGVAVEGGAVWRPWEAAYGQWPLQARLTGGTPWGFQLALGTELSSVSGGVPAQGLVASLEIDLLRLTVMRQGATEQWWPNPAPAGGHVADSR